MLSLWGWLPRSPWNPGSLQLSWCRRACAARCTRSSSTPAGRQTSPWTCAPSPPHLPWFWWTRRARPTSCKTTFSRRRQFLISGREERREVKGGQVSRIKMLPQLSFCRALYAFCQPKGGCLTQHGQCWQRKPLLRTRILSTGFWAHSELGNANICLLKIPSKAQACFSQQQWKVHNTVDEADLMMLKREQSKNPFFIIKLFKFSFTFP